MDPTPLVASFTLFAVMELGDKTQLAVVALSARGRARDVFIGATAALALVDGVSVLLGVAVASLLPTLWIRLGSGATFLAMGLLGLGRREEEERGFDPGLRALLSVFTLVAAMELGDKTQIASIALAARYGSPATVFLGILLASAVVSGGGVLLGRGLSKFLSQRRLRFISSALLLTFGVLFLLSAIWGVEIL